MPTIFIIDSIKILIYYEDHLPPHFHVIYNEFEELIEIETFHTYRGNIPAVQRKKVIKWAMQNQKKLMIIWDKYYNT